MSRVHQSLEEGGGRPKPPVGERILSGEFRVSASFLRLGSCERVDASEAYVLVGIALVSRGRGVVGISRNSCEIARMQLARRHTRRPKQRRGRWEGCGSGEGGGPKRMVQAERGVECYVTEPGLSGDERVERELSEGSEGESARASYRFAQPACC